MATGVRNVNDGLVGDADLCGYPVVRGGWKVGALWLLWNGYNVGFVSKVKTILMFVETVHFCFFGVWFNAI